MLNLLKNEIKKNNIGIVFIVAAFLFIGINILLSISIDSYTMSNWREKSIEEKQLADKFIEQNKKEPEDDSEEIIASWEETKAEIDYCLENNIPYGMMSAWEYLINIDGMGTFVFLIVIIFVAKVFNVEDEFGTWKNIFTSCVSKRKVVISKVIYGTLLAAILAVFFFAISFVFGLLQNGGISDHSFKYWQGNYYIEKNAVSLVMLIYLIFVFKAIIYAEMTLFISAVCKKNIFSYMIPLIVLLIGELIYDRFDGYNISKYLPFRYMFTIGQDYVSGTYSMSTCMIILSIYSVLFMILSVGLFKRSDC